MLQQYLPFTVLKPSINISCSEAYCVATVLTVYGIETIPDKLMNDGEGLVELQQYLPFTVLKRIFCKINSSHDYPPELQQYLPFTVCDEGCEIAEEQSDDEVRTSLVPDRREGKTKAIR